MSVNERMIAGSPVVGRCASRKRLDWKVLPNRISSALIRDVEASIQLHHLQWGQIERLCRLLAVKFQTLLLCDSKADVAYIFKDTKALERW